MGIVIWEASSNTYLCCPIGELQTHKNKLRATHHSFHFSHVFRTPDKHSISCLNYHLICSKFDLKMITKLSIFKVGYCKTPKKAHSKIYDNIPRT